MDIATTDLGGMLLKLLRVRLLPSLAMNVAALVAIGFTIDECDCDSTYCVDFWCFYITWLITEWCGYYYCCWLWWRWVREEFSFRVITCWGFGGSWTTGEWACEICFYCC